MTPYRVKCRQCGWTGTNEEQVVILIDRPGGPPGNRSGCPLCSGRTDMLDKNGRVIASEPHGTWFEIQDGKKVVTLEALKALMDDKNF